MTGPLPDIDYDEDFEEADPSDEEMDLDECGLMADGQCSMAGTEHCDWSCPYTLEAAHNRALKRRRRP